ncbi:hypothetical protein E4U47_000528 [Claviceps purpurea]|nr:hypothetical protein E4U47_000528 [Claviceps purpurea]
MVLKVERSRGTIQEGYLNVAEQLGMSTERAIRLTPAPDGSNADAMIWTWIQDGWSVTDSQWMEAGVVQPPATAHHQPIN